MQAGKIVITTKGVDAKLINRLLLYVRDWEFGFEGSWDRQRILRTRDEVFAADLPVDIPPVHDVGDGRAAASESFENQWEGLSIEEVEKYMLSHDEGGDNTSLILVLDDKGRHDQTLIVAMRAYNPDEDTLYLPEYDKVRVPWQEVHSMWTNLDMANMNFDEFCDEEIGADGNRWWTYKPTFDEDHYAGVAEKRDPAIKELEKLDMA
ncbi:hypothetical protein JX265_002161 [Neoarthrinium moseri]|uniref:DUF6924 domain-containing protein n=1 Tax=Neoarthrinium moseri TaxID=1658444 RepID=A0A9Q0AT89_9PEZI|nr:hypothetical protein JX265_002161 [Neoarthrinium moseri]